MVQRQIIEISDDLDGSSEGVDTYIFTTHRGVEYEIDLNEKHAEEMDQLFEKYVEVARRLTPAPRARRASEPPRVMPVRNASASEIREWAVANNYEVNLAGRIPYSVIEAFNAAH